MYHCSKAQGPSRNRDKKEQNAGAGVWGSGVLAERQVRKLTPPVIALKKMNKQCSWQGS